MPRRSLRSVADTYFLTTPIYYVNGAPHLGHAYTTIVGDALARWHRLLGEDVHFLTGTDEHGQKVQDAADAAGLTPQEFVDAIAPLYQQAWEQLDISNDDFIRTTEERHKVGVGRAAAAVLRRRRHRARRVRGQVLRGLRGVLHRRRADRRPPVPDPQDRGASTTRRRTTSSASAASRTACSSGTPRTPRRSCPSSAATRRSGLIRGGLRDFSVSRTSLKWGIPLPWDPEHVAYVWFDALANYLTAVGFGTDEATFDQLVAGAPPDRQGHHPPPLRVLAGDAAVGRHRAADAVGRRRLAAQRRREDEQDRPATSSTRSTSIDEFGVDGFRYYVLAETPYGNDGDFTYEGLIARYNSDLANNLGNLLSRVATVVGKKCGGVGPAPAADSPAGRGAPPRRYDGHGRGVGGRPAQPRPRSDVVADPRHQRLPRGERAVEGRAGPGGRRRASATRSRRCASSPCSPRPALPDHVPDDLGAHRSAPVSVTDQRVPAAAAWGGYPGGVTVTKGAPLFPRKR